MWHLCILNILNTSLQIFGNIQQYFNCYFDIKAFHVSIENWCDPRHLQGSHALADMPKSILILSISIIMTRFMFSVCVIDCVVISCFTSTRTIVERKLKVCVGGRGEVLKWASPAPPGSDSRGRWRIQWVERHICYNTPVLY